ncbi:MAG TPA: alanine dehydrogenase [Baekduia sp.]|nr:alanine dehydrogenase [Baekduia sp.]
MRIGVPTEIKPGEGRVALTPAGVRELVGAGAEILVQAGAGLGSRFPDAAYAAEGATLVADADALWAQAELVVKVKEPQPEEVARLRPDHVLFAYLHLAPDLALTRGIQESGATAIAFETVTDRTGRLPLLAPMSEVAGRLSAQFAAAHLLAHQGGRGVLAGGVPGVRPARAVVIGGGSVGENAARVALGLGFDTVVIDRSVPRLRELAGLFDQRVRTVAASDLAIETELADADVVIGAILAPGALAPHVVRREHLALLGEGAVVVDVSIDQGGCLETSRPTTHYEPTFVVDGVVHNCVANMPGAVPSTSTQALMNATLPYMVEFATRGVAAAIGADPGLADGVNVAGGQIVHPAVAAAHGETAVPFDAAVLQPV